MYFKLIWEKILLRAQHPSNSETHKVNFNPKKTAIFIKIDCLDKEFAFTCIEDGVQHFLHETCRYFFAIFGSIENSNILLSPRVMRN